jgi:putative nucleotidyltransferase with HDIG domain
MSSANLTFESYRNRLRDFVRKWAVWLFAVGMTLAMTLILSLNLGGASDVEVTVGQPAPNDILSPSALSFTSPLLTQQAREQAMRNVADVYTPLDLSIGRAQLAEARAIFAFIDAVRADASAPVERKVEYLQAIESLRITDEVARGLINLSPADYERVQRDVLRIVEDLMREEIRPSQLGDFQRTARRLASLDLSPLQTTIVTEFAYQLIVPTVFPDDNATAERRAEAADQVEPVIRQVAPDQRIVRAGEIVTEADMELMTELGLLQPERGWTLVLSMFMASVLFVGLITLYWVRFQRQQFPNGRYVLVLAILILLFTVAAKIMMGNDSLSYWYPLAALSMLLAVVYDTRFAILVTALMAMLAGFISPNSLELAFYLLAGGLLSILTMRDAQRITGFFRAGLWAALGYVFVAVMYWLPRGLDLTTIVPIALFGLGNGILSSGLTLAGFYILGGLFGIVTVLQLQDLSRLDHPLLRELLRRAPGTYHHSIMVANLAEQAAERVGANSTLVRVGSFYHDVGKMVRPPFFTENQEGVNPHDSLDPTTSARIIIAHVKDGLELGARYHLPFRITDIIAQHHGTRTIKSFYHKAKEQAGEDADELDPRPFTYPGPRPRTREAGIVLLADAIDAASSAVRPNTEKAIEKLVNSIVEDDILNSQLVESGLTLGDVDHLRLSFIETLKGRFHVRVQYPGNEEFISENNLAGVLPPGSTVPQLDAGVHPETGVQPETARRSEVYSAD